MSICGYVILTLSCALRTLSFSYILHTVAFEFGRFERCQFQVCLRKLSTNTLRLTSNIDICYICSVGDLFLMLTLRRAGVKDHELQCLWMGLYTRCSLEGRILQALCKLCSWRYAKLIG